MIATEQLVEVDKKLYFKSRYIPGTFVYDLVDDTTRFIDEKENFDFKSLGYLYAIKYKDYIIFPPLMDEKFIIYSVKEEKFTYIDKPSKCIYTSYKVIGEMCYFFSAS